MKKKITITNAARQDMRDINFYISARNSVQVADKQLNKMRIEKEIKILRVFDGRRDWAQFLI